MSDFHETWPECLLGIIAPKCVRLLRNRNTFLVAPPSVTRTEQSFIVQLQSGFKCYFRNKDKASHTLLAYLLLSDIDQLVLMFTLTGRLVIQ